MNCIYEFFDAELFSQYFSLDVFSADISSMLYVNKDVKVKSIKGKLLKGYTHLHMCVMNTKKFTRLNDYIKEYIQKYPDELNKVNEAGETPLMTSLLCYGFESDPFTYKVLLELGADINAKDNDGCTALQYSMNYPSYEVIKNLIKYGADIHIKNNAGSDAAVLYLMDSKKKSKKIFNLLVDNTEEQYNLFSEEKIVKLNILEISVNFLHFNLARDLINKGAVFSNPIFNAMEKCMMSLPFDQDFFNLLLEKNVEINNYRGKHLIEYALMPISIKKDVIYFLNVDSIDYIIDKFIERGMDINMTLSDGGCILMLIMTIFQEYLYFFEKLIKIGIDINKTDSNGNYPIEYLVNPCEKLIKLLLDNGQHINPKIYALISGRFPSLKIKMDSDINKKIKEIETRNKVINSTCNICLENKSVISCKNDHLTCKKCIKNILKFRCEFCTVEY